MALLKTQGIVLRYTNLGEADKILTILTRHKGKIQATAKGCRKPKSSLLSSCETFTCSEFVFYQGAKFYRISQAETMETFYNIRNDLLKLSYASYFTELADSVSDEEIPSEKLFVLLAKALYYLAQGELPVGLLSLAYELKLMSISGYHPSLEGCIHCGSNKEKNYKFSIDMGGIICEDCHGVDTKAYKMSPGTLEGFNFLLNTEISRVNTIKLDNTNFNEIDKITKAFIQRHLDKNFKSLEFLDEIKNAESRNKYF